MVESFSRTISLLRQEKNLSQRSVARDLGVSQALLSHYENGLREPGLAFLIKVGDYYNVSVDYLLGRTMSREGTRMDVEQLHDAEQERDSSRRGSVMCMLQKKLLLNSVVMLLDIIDKADLRGLLTEVSTYLNIAIYKMFRYIYHKNPRNPAGLFKCPPEVFSELCDSELKRCEAAIKTPDEKKKADHDLLSLSSEELKNDYPLYVQSMLSLLHGVEDKLDR